uniref:Staphylococcal nuclease domain-containing protein 1 n=1 Tax=Strigamia maritima TaxID=126957 RepID=T1J5F9_STRMM
MASSSLSQEDFEVDYEASARRTRVRTARARNVNAARPAVEVAPDSAVDGAITAAAVDGAFPGEHDASPKPPSLRPKDKRPARPNHMSKGKQQRDRRKLREKRRSTGVVHLPSTESTGGSTGEDEDELLSLNAETKKILYTMNFPSDLEADDEDNQDYDSTVNQSNSNASLAQEESSWYRASNGRPQTPSTENLEELLERAREENKNLLELLEKKDQKILQLERDVTKLKKDLQTSGTDCDKLKEENAALIWSLSQLSVLSGDTVVIRDKPRSGPPPELTVSLSNIISGKLARRPNPPNVPETKDEVPPFAWEAREYLRKKLIGKEVTYSLDKKIPGGTRDCGYVYLGGDITGENVAHALVAEGLVEVRKGGLRSSEEYQKLVEIEEQARAASRGKFSTTADENIRNVIWNLENPSAFVATHNKPVSAVVENVRDGCTVRVFVLPEFQYVTVMMSGIRTPMFKVGEDSNAEEFAEEAKFFTESRLLQRDIEIKFNKVLRNNIFATIIHPNGSIAEVLVKEGYARVVEWTLPHLDAQEQCRLRAAEKHAKEKRLRIWKNYVPSANDNDIKEKKFEGKVVEIVNADALVLKLADSNTLKKIFLASIRPPRLTDSQPQETATKDTKGKQFRPLYDIPYMYEAREFLRQKLIGRKVDVNIDYIQPKSESFPEKVCCTVCVGGSNVAETLVLKGLASVIRYRMDDDKRSSRYDDLLIAEEKAMKSKKGIHSGKELPKNRVADISGDYAKAKQFFPFLQRAGRSNAVVEYVASGSRLRLYVPRETCLITFLLAGINCPRITRPGPNNTTFDGEAYGPEALEFTKDLCLQKEVEIEVDNMDKIGNFIGWLWVGGKNLSVGLVEEGLSSVHFTAERSQYFRELQIAETAAKEKKLKIWANYEEPKEIEVKEEIKERLPAYKSVLVTVLHSDFSFYAQQTDQGAQLEQLMNQLREEFTSRTPVAGAYNPRKDDLCAAKFTDGLWYRAKVESISGGNVNILYVDYGNREATNSTKLAQLPTTFHGIAPFAHKYSLACVAIPSDPDSKESAFQALLEDIVDKTFMMNIEYRLPGMDYVSMIIPDSRDDVAKLLISDGILILEVRKEKRLQKLVGEYRQAQEQAKKKRLNLWCYGDFTDDDAKEFGYKR